ncbi:PLP-dependent aminotransferase family protein [Vibrio sp. 10N.286.49.B1]|uniref:MocR-like pyridoxine biosynthesis transcription factor PdxR n=1 Tax=unclassified Vibrio TaxID=2614977 RepID=UPI000C8669D3|nr:MULTISPECIES: PLP-dependent aminotransferase family protein [unclassified Vibrio]
MSEIDVGDITLSTQKQTLQRSLFEQIREKILQGHWISEAKLPSTRNMAIELKVSRNTVIQAYDQLVAEGYLIAKPKAGFFVAVALPDRFLSAHSSPAESMLGTSRAPSNGLFSPGIADLSLFPDKQWQRCLQRHAGRTSLLGNQDLQGLLTLRDALARYLSSSRSVACSADQIIVTSGAQQSIAIALLATQSENAHSLRHFLVERPGYRQVVKVLDLFSIAYDYVDATAKDGLDLEAVLSKSASGIYLTPSNQYPMGYSLNTAQRLQLIEWAKKNESWIIEDDYDSEFQFDSRPFSSMQGLAAKADAAQQVIYIGSMSKVMFNALRVGYMVVPEHLVAKCLEIKDALTGDTPSHIQAGLADFIEEGSLVRHIRKMRRVYEDKCQAMTRAIEDHFSGDWSVISQAAGLHTTVQWHSGVDEEELSRRANEIDIIVRPLCFYEPKEDKVTGKHISPRKQGALVLGFGNAPMDDISPCIKQLSMLYYELLVAI